MRFKPLLIFVFASLLLSSCNKPFVSSEGPTSESPSSEGPGSSEGPTSENPSPLYYDSITESMKGADLKNALYNIIKNHTKLNYDNLEIYMRTTDRDWERSPDENDLNPYMNLMYYTKNNDDSMQQTWNKYHSGNNPISPQMWNKEHIWAKSNGFPGSSQPAYSDLHHLRASDKLNNGTRSNFPFAEVGASFTNVNDFSNSPSGKKGTVNGVTVYEPRDEDKGDVARALLYMATRYGSESINLELLDNNASSGGKWGFLSVLLKWNLEDLPDDFEAHRNDLVYSFQNNRNPFIDHPEYGCKIYSNLSNASSAVKSICS